MFNRTFTPAHPALKLSVVLQAYARRSPNHPGRVQLRWAWHSATSPACAGQLTSRAAAEADALEYLATQARTAFAEGRMYPDQLDARLKELQA